MTETHQANQGDRSTLTTKGKLTVLFVFFIAALVHTTYWSSITPLWQIPDEAAHYEYVRLMVKLGRPPQAGDEDPQIQSALLRSMWENHYWEYLGFKRPEQPPTRFLPGGWISGGAIPDTAVVGDAYIYAFSNLSNAQPVYYAMLAPIQRATLDRPIDDQLRALRVGSRVIFALAVVFIVLTAMELFGSNLVLVIGAGLIAVLQPMFVYIGAGLNNDVGVTFMVALLAWQVALAWHRGFSWWRIGLIVLTAVAAVLTKRTAVFTLVWVPLVVGVWWLRRLDPRAARRIVLGGAAVVVVLTVLAAALYVIPGPLPSNWTSTTPWKQAWTSQQSHSGARAFMMQDTDHSIFTSINRPIGMADGSPVVFTGWAKAGSNAVASMRVESNSGIYADRQFSLSDDWQPLSVTLNLPPNSSRLRFVLADATTSPIYVDDLRAVIQTTQTMDLPLPNSSAEIATPMLAQVILEASRGLGVYGPAMRAVQDYRANLAALPERLQLALWFTNWTFWGRFGIFARAQNPAVALAWETPLGVLDLLALASVVAQLIFRRSRTPQSTLLALFVTGVVLLLLQTFAPLLSFAAQGLWLPQGRYLFSGMALIASVMACGWINWLDGRGRWVALAFVVIILSVVDLAAIQAVRGFFAL